jgi:hypothetical protein
VRNLFTFALALACAASLSVDAQAEIGWAGNAYPNNGFVTTPTGDQFVVAQVYKAGTTDSPGQGPDIAARLVYQTDLMGAPATVAMNYNVDIGNNDEYLGFIPQMDLAGASYVDVTVYFDDLSDGTEFQITQDQNGNPPPLRYSISNVLPVDVAVTFTMCMSGTPTTGAPCVIGSAAVIGAWGTGVPMNNVTGELWEQTVIFPAGSSPVFEYKYKADDCTNWESVGNRFVSLPTDGTDTVVLAIDSFNNAPLGCDLGQILSEDKVLCFQVCMEGVDYTGGVCVIGNIAALTGWTTGVPMTMVGPSLYQACITIPAGTAIPQNLEYKFKKDDCNTWEDVANRGITVDNDSLPETLLFHTWNDGPGTCDPVSGDTDSFGGVKARFHN